MFSRADVPLGSAICWDLAHRRVQQSLTLGDHSSWTHSARALGGGAEESLSPKKTSKDAGVPAASTGSRKGWRDERVWTRPFMGGARHRKVVRSLRARARELWVQILTLWQRSSRSTSFANWRFNGSHIPWLAGLNEGTSTGRVRGGNLPPGAPGLGDV